MEKRRFDRGSLALGARVLLMITAGRRRCRGHVSVFDLVPLYVGKRRRGTIYNWIFSRSPTDGCRKFCLCNRAV